MSNLNVFYLNSAKADSKDLSIGRARFELKPPLNIPQVSGLKVACHSFSFTNFFINVSATLTNNHFYFSNDLLDTTKFDILIPDGSYSVTELSETINNGVINLGQPDGLIKLIPDYATNKVQFNISQAGWFIFFGANSPYELLGTILNQTIPNAGLTIGAYTELGPNVATFNSILNLYLHTNLSNSSIFSDGRQSDIIASIVPTASIGSIQETREFNLIWLNADNLGGLILSNIDLYITDQDGDPVNLSDDYSATLILSR
jgi:hypothetical protein